MTVDNAVLFSVLEIFTQIFFFFFFDWTSIKFTIVDCIDVGTGRVYFFVQIIIKGKLQ